MKIAITGIRGIPANYGGFETFAENLSVELVTRGHEVTVYGRSNNIQYPEKQYRGVNLIILPTIGTKHLDTVAHTFVCAVHTVFMHYDVVLICNAANAMFSWIPRIGGAKVALNVDGIERRRRKWGPVAKTYYRFSERLATFAPNAIITDAETIKVYYENRYAKDSMMIPYGADVGREKTGADFLNAQGLAAEKYILYVSRLEPENNAHMAIDAYSRIDTDMPLVIVGDAPYATSYITGLKETKDPRVKFLGFVFGDGYKILQQNAFAYIQATEVGGTHAALLEAMGFGNCVLALDTPEHREVASDAAIYFDSADNLAIELTKLLDHPELVRDLGQKAMNKILEKYSWKKVTDQYEALFNSLIGAGQSDAL